MTLKPAFSIVGAVGTGLYTLFPPPDYPNLDYYLQLLHHCPMLPAVSQLFEMISAEEDGRNRLWVMVLLSAQNESLAEKVVMDRIEKEMKNLFLREDAAAGSVSTSYFGDMDEKMALSQKMQ